MSRTSVFDEAWELDLLTAVFEWPDAAETISALQTVRPEWFLARLHRALWEVILSCSSDRGGIDEAAIWTMVRKDARFSDSDRMRLEGGLFNLTGRRVVGSASGPAEALREAWLRRSLSKMADGLVRMACDFTASMAELEAKAIELSDLVLSTESRSDVQESDLSGCVDLWLDGSPLMPKALRRNYLVTGLPTIDHAIVAGPGSMGVMAAKTSAGKTSLAAVQVAVRSQASGIQTAIFSLEMGREELAARIIASASGMPSSAILREGIRSRRIETDWVTAARRIQVVTKIPGRTLAAIASKIRQLVKKHGVRLVVIDYFTLINPPELRRNATTAYMLGEMSKAFKTLASDLGICILLVSQLNRGVQDGERPTLECLRETGQLEQDANFVVMLWAEKARYEAEEDRIVFVELQKNRGGSRWVKATAEFRPSTSRFVELEKPRGIECPEWDDV